MVYKDRPRGQANMGMHQQHDLASRRRLCVRTYIRLRRLAYVNACWIYMCSMKSMSESENDILLAVEDRGFQMSKTDKIVGAPC
jgi:hypothetical protein